MILSRRSFLHCSLMAGGLVVVPRFGRWFQRVREPEFVLGPYEPFYIRWAERTTNGLWRMEYSYDRGKTWVS